MALIKLYVGRDSMDAHHVRAMLTEAGLRAVVLGDSLAFGRGELPFTMQTQPAVWVDEADAERAVQIINDHGVDPAAHAGGPPVEWTCASCGEAVEPQFDLCWNCGASRDGAANPGFEPAVIHNPVCAACGHLLIGVRADQCPECGHIIDRTRRDTPLDLPKRDG